MQLNKYNIKKWMQRLSFGLLAIGSFTACIMDDKGLPDCPDIIPAKDPLMVTASLYCQNKKIEWQQDSRIGLILLDGDSDKPIYPAVSHEFCLQDPLTEIFLPARGVPSVERPEVGVTLDATGVYPYGTTVNDRLEVAFSVADQSNQQKLDLITAERTTGITHATDTVHIDYYRRLSRLQFALSLTEVAADGSRKNADDKLAGATIEVDGMDLSGLFSLKTHALSTSSPATFKAYVQNDGKSGQAIVFPRQAGKGITFKVRLPQYRDTLYTFAMDPELVLVSCKSYTFDMKLEYKHASGGVKPDPDPTPDPDPDEPEIPDPNPVTHKVNYIFAGEANSGNVTVFKNGVTTLWGLNEIITVDDKGSFSFGYNSNLTVSIRTKDGTYIPLGPDKIYSFSNITSDITIIISAEKLTTPDDSKTHKVNYIFAGDANSGNVTVYKNGVATIWNLSEVITVNDKGSFTFGYNSQLEVSIRIKDGGDCILDPNTSYTFNNITSDITIVITAKPKTHKVNYIFAGDATPDNVTVYKNGVTTGWSLSEVIKVNDKGSFTFGYNSLLKVEITTKDGTSFTPGSNNSFTFNNITADITITISATKSIPPVDPGLPETPPEHNDPNDNPDLNVLRADIIDWVENYEINGGIITPKK